ncbi:mutator type transposase [Tanacetum coccineum]
MDIYIYKNCGLLYEPNVGVVDHGQASQVTKEIGESSQQALQTMTQRSMFADSFYATSNPYLADNDFDPFLDLDNLGDANREIPQSVGKGKGGLEIVYEDKIIIRGGNEIETNNVTDVEEGSDSKEGSYVMELKASNPNTTVRIGVKSEADHTYPKRVFKRIYICLGAAKAGFKACMMDFLGFDGAFMKGSFPCQLLTAVGIDSNNGIYPLAYGSVESESKDYWTWFLEHLKKDLELQDNSNFTFISDRQKGIIPAIEALFPAAEHRFDNPTISKEDECLKRLQQRLL